MMSPVSFMKNTFLVDDVKELVTIQCVGQDPGTMPVPIAPVDYTHTGGIDRLWCQQILDKIYNHLRMIILWDGWIIIRTLIIIETLINDCYWNIIRTLIIIGMLIIDYYWNIVQ